MYPDSDRKRKLFGIILIIIGTATILITFLTNTSAFFDFFESSSSQQHSNLNKLKSLTEKANEACEIASRQLSKAQASSVSSSSSAALPGGPSKDENSIFVSIASYRDEECAPTIFDMFAKAKNPRSIFVGIVEQHDASGGDVPCIPKQWETMCQHDTWCPSDNVRIRKIAPKDAKGPTYGRYIGALMYGGERFYMMIDSHNRFVTNWDEIAIKMYLRIPTAKPVLSHYPEAWHNPLDKGTQTNAPLDNRPTTTYLCKARVLPGMGYLRLDGFVVSRKANCRPQPWAAAGFLFAYGKLLREVPFDPHLDFVFDGEEICYSARMWTSGWNIYSPSENILYHYYYRVKAKRFWGLLPSNWQQRRDGAIRRIQSILEIYKFNTTQPLIDPNTKEEAVTIEKDKYGLGKSRKIDDWYQWIGFNRVKWTTNEDKFCKQYS